MLKMMNKKIVAIVALGLVLGLSTAFQVPVKAALPNEISVSAQIKFEQGAYVDWSKGAESEIVATGLGYNPENMVGRGMGLARRAAIVDAYRMLAETIKGVQVDADTTIESLIVQNDTIRTNVSAVIKGAKIVSEGKSDDGGYYVVLSLPLFGEKNSVASAVLPDTTKNIVTEPAPKVDEKTTPLTKEEMKEVRSVTYTGIVVDASSLGLEATFSPVIYDTNGRAIYGMKNINKDYAISKGMVEYSTDVQAAAGGSTRAGANPLVVKATAVKGGGNSINPVNVVVSVEDGDKILLANEKAPLLNECAVVFVK